MVQAAGVVRLALPVPTLLVLESLERTATGVALRVHGRSRRRPPCPSCGGSAVVRHGYHERHLADLPWLGCRVTLQLKLRRFRCGNPRCPRRTFVEQLPGLALPRGRETLRLSQLMRRVGYAVGGRPGARLLVHCGVATSDDTVLRRVTAAPTRTDTVAVRVLGVDDWAWRRRQHYGTMLMDLERCRVVDLLPVRSAGSFAQWLLVHPGVEVITRDRSTLYADGGRFGAPRAVQINDRYHLLANLSDAVESDVRELELQAGFDQARGLRPSPPSRESRRLRCRQARYERYQAVMNLTRRGETQLEIAAKLGLGPSTVSNWQHAGHFPERRIRSDRRRDQFRAPRRDSAAWSTPPVATHFAPSRVAGLLAKASREMKAPQRSYLCSFFRLCPVARRLRRLILGFRAMLRWRRANRLATWIDKASTAGFRSVAQYAKTLRRDIRAAELAITTPWSNGPIEGQINRLKCIKRQMYGRAGFALLKARVLPFEPVSAP